MLKIIAATDYNSQSRKAAAVIAAEVTLNSKACLGLATGSSPIGLYKQLIAWHKQGDLDFSGITAANLDEYVGLDAAHEQSYKYFMKTNLFDSINIDQKNCYIPNGLAKDDEGKRYDDVIAALGGVDLQLLGLGLNGHIGFNEPDSCFAKGTHLVELTASTIEANARFFASRSDVPTQAYTMGIKTIMAAKKILLIANGDAKAQILYDALFGEITPNVPASILQLHPDVTVVADDCALKIIKEKGLL